MLRNQAIEGADLQTEPYRWARIDTTLDPADAGVLSSEWPAADFWPFAGSAERSFSYSVRPLVIIGHGVPSGLTPLSPAWQRLVDDLLAPEYRDALSALTGVDLGAADMDASLRRFDRGGHLGPHRDAPNKIITQIIYFEEDWAPNQGGCLRILGSNDEDDVVAELPPHLGTSSVLVRDERSWHSVTPVQATAATPRRSLQVIWLPRGSDSSAWKVRSDGSLVPRTEPRHLPRVRAHLRRAVLRLRRP